MNLALTLFLGTLLVLGLFLFFHNFTNEPIEPKAIARVAFDAPIGPTQEEPYILVSKHIDSKA